MVFVKAQALDNRSEDLWMVYDSEKGNDRLAQQRLREAVAYVQLHASPWTSGSTRIWHGSHGTPWRPRRPRIVLQVRSNEQDTLGRPAPLLFSYEVSKSSPEDIARVVAAGAHSVGRSVDEDDLARTLTEWQAYRESKDRRGTTRARAVSERSERSRRGNRP